MSKIEYAINEETALAEVKAFVEHHLEVDDFKDKEILQLYPDVILAVRKGALVFDGNKVPTFTLSTPILNKENEISQEKITFLTRIKASEKEKIVEGIDADVEQLKLRNRLKAFFMGFPVAMLDKIQGKFDNRVIEQVCSVFP